MSDVSPPLLLFPRFAKQPAKVNVRKLKCSIWEQLNVQLQVESTDESSPELMFTSDSTDLHRSSTSKSLDLNAGSVSFQELIADMSHLSRVDNDPTVNTGSENNAPSMHFYFVCLLHLANEKVGAFFYLSLSSH